MIEMLLLTVLFFVLCYGGQATDGWLHSKEQEARAAWLASHPLPEPLSAAERRVAMYEAAREASR